MVCPSRLLVLELGIHFAVRVAVALTRPRALLIVLGNPRVLGQVWMWRTFLNFVQKRGGCTGMPLTWNVNEDVKLPGVYVREDVLQEDQIAGEEFINRIRSSIIRRGQRFGRN